MPYLGSQPNAEFGAGVNHVTNPGPSNENSITLDGGPGLQADDARWNNAVGQVAADPHSALAPFAFSRAASSNGSDGTNFVADYGRTGTGNGESQGTFDTNLRLRMAGDSAAETD